MIVDDSFQAHLDTRVRGKRGWGGGGVGEMFEKGHCLLKSSVPLP